MFGMSLFDVLSSVAVSLSTLPMPVDLPFPHAPYDGTRLGNIYTCQAQGFAFTLGFITVFTYNAMLFVYYTCAIAFQIEDKKIAKYVEPILHIISVASGLTSSILPLIHGLYNPTLWDAWCSIAASEGVGGDAEEFYVKTKNINVITTAIIMTLVASIISSIILIMWKVIQEERKMNQTKLKRYSARLAQATKSRQNNIKVVFIQAMTYLLAFMITLGIILVRSVIVEPQWMIYLSFYLVPLQGFFNALIFIAHKVHNYRRLHSDISRCNVIKLLFKGKAQDPFLFSISLVRMCDNERDEDNMMCSSNEDDSKDLRIGNNENISAFESSNNHVYVDEESKVDLDSFIGFPSVTDPSPYSNNCIREGLSGFSDSSGIQDRP